MAQLNNVAWAEMQKVVDEVLENKEKIRILEAGCGSVSHVKFKQEKYFVGIDISEKQLVRNVYLDEKILGDIQHYVFSPMSFDVIVCWDVFEHLPEPEKALDKFVNCIKDNGIIILKMPNLLSLKGLVTKYTPHWFHVLWYKHVYGRKDAGKEDVGPFITYMRNSISAKSMCNYASENGLDVVLCEIFDGSFLKNRNIIVYKIYAMLKTMLKVISLGKLGESELLIIMKSRSLMQ